MNQWSPGAPLHVCYTCMLISMVCLCPASFTLEHLLPPAMFLFGPHMIPVLLHSSNSHWTSLYFCRIPVQLFRQWRVRDYFLWTCSLSECGQLHLLWGLEERQPGRGIQGDLKQVDITCLPLSSAPVFHLVCLILYLPCEKWFDHSLIVQCSLFLFCCNIIVV